MRLLKRLPFSLLTNSLWLAFGINGVLAAWNGAPDIEPIAIGWVLLIGPMIVTFSLAVHNTVIDLMPIVKDFRYFLKIERDVASRFHSQPQVAVNWLVNDGADQDHIHRFVSGEIDRKQFLKGLPWTVRSSPVVRLIADNPDQVLMSKLTKLAD